MATACISLTHSHSSRGIFSSQWALFSDTWRITNTAHYVPSYVISKTDKLHYSPQWGLFWRAVNNEHYTRPWTLLWKKKRPNITPHYESCSGWRSTPRSGNFVCTLSYPSAYTGDSVWPHVSTPVPLDKKKPIPIECEAGWSTERDYGEKNLPSVGCRTPIPRSLTSRLNKCIELPCCVICYYYYFKSQKRKHWKSHKK